MTWVETYVSWQPRVLSLLRIMTGLLFLQYGMAKLLKFPAVPAFKRCFHSMALPERLSSLAAR
jgi:uncharacterized membrane protein YphA (DoxX/SURF4 family)